MLDKSGAHPQINLRDNPSPALSRRPRYYVALSFTALAWLCVLGLRPQTASAQSPCAPPPQSLVNWYRAEGNGTDTRGTRTATLANGATFATGKVGQAFSFDGVDDQVTTTATDALNNPNALTIEAWVRPALRTDGTDFPANVVDNRTASGLGPSGRGFGLNVFSGGSQLKVLSGDLSRVVPGVSFTADTWYHIAVAYTAYDFKVYVNGQVVDQVALLNTTHTASAHPGDSLIRIGWNRGNTMGTNTPDFFKGLIDEVGIYNAALSAADVQAIYNADTSGKCTAQSCVTQLDALLDWYQAENNASDTNGGQGGVLVNGTAFTTGKVGQAFNLDGVNDYV
ncbi:MAG TPA: LamG domain-containing protein, partial [Pyrinomonadaceae bacterium]|nr:LamG domain-containing protein [Pyrinomonadaceae bacterium]